MPARRSSLLALLLTLTLALSASPRSTAAANPAWSGGVNVLSVLPERVCVGDTITLEGAASVTYMKDLPVVAGMALSPLPVTSVQIQAEHGQVTPAEITQYNDGFYFNFTYKAASPGMETITLTLNEGLAEHQERFEVQEKCDFDAFLLTVMHFSADMDEMQFRSLTHVSGTGTMKRDREGSPFYQGDGTWHLEETILSKPPDCVEFYAPPLIMSGPFELDGRLADEGDTLDVILSFLPKQGEAVYYGKMVCIDENGEAGYGWGYAQGGDPAMAAKIEATFPMDGGSQIVEMEGAGLNLVQSVGVVDYTASLTLIPR